MKFYSKFSNHRMVLRPGIPGEPLLGRAPQPGIYVKFEDGVADVKDEAIIETLMNHRNFGKTFVAEKESSVDPYKSQRRDLEPEHDVTEIQYGHVGKSLNPKPKMAMNREQKEMVMEVAQELAKQMLLSMAAEKKAELDNAAAAEEEGAPAKEEEAKPESLKKTPAPKKK